MDPPAELPLNGTHEELALGKINWLPGEHGRGGDGVDEKGEEEEWGRAGEEVKETGGV